MTMTKLSTLAAAGLAATLAATALPAAAQDDPGAAIVAALTGPITRLAALSGNPPDKIFAKPPQATEGPDGWQVDLPSWRLRFTAEDTPTITFGCGPERWTATIAADGTVSAESDSPMACELRTLGEDGSLQRFLVPDRHASAVIGAGGDERWTFAGDALAYGARSMPSTETATTGPFEVTVETGPSVTAGLQDGTARARFEDVDWSETMLGIAFHADRVSYEESVEGLDLDGVMGLMQEAVALGAAMRPGMDPLDPDETDPDVAARFAALLPKLADTVGSIRETMSAQGFAISMFGTTVKLGGLDYAWALEDVRSDDSTGSLRMSLSDVTTDPAAPEVEPWLPRHALLSARVEGLPLPSALGVLADVVADPNLIDGTAAIADLSEAFRRAGARLVVDSLSWRSDSLAFDIDGEIAATGATALGLTARAGVVVAGLGALIELFQHLPEGDTVAAGLTALSLFGKPGRSLDGKDSRQYELSISEDGRILLNGTDLTKLLP